MRFVQVMANYIAWFGKKREHLIEREREFVALLQSDADATKLAACAEAVRAAQIRALKAKRAQLRPSERYAVAMEHLEDEIAFWLGLSFEQIAAGYRTEKLKGHRSKAVRKAAR
jgi:hypothetical protein